MGSVQGRSFQTITTKRPWYKQPGAIIALAIFVFLGGVAWYLLKGPEETLLARVKAYDGISPVCAYALGWRGIKSDATRDAFEQILATGATDKPAPEDVRRACAYALGMTRQQHVVTYLIDALKKDPNLAVRCAAARALGKTGEPMACEPLMAALGDGDADMREAAAWACKDLNNKTAIDPLIDHVEDGSPVVRRAAHEALVALSGTTFDGIDEKKSWQKWRETH
jgi:HEAT repeat protein